MRIVRTENKFMSDEQIDQVVKVLKDGGIIIFPTETVYGIGCNAFDKIAVDKIYELKTRSHESKSSVMVGDVKDIEKYAQVGEIDREFINRNLPGPVTVVVKIKPEYFNTFATQVINDTNGVGFRVVDNFEYINKICKKCDFPILSTSANKSGLGIEKASCENAMKAFENEKDKIDIVICAEGYQGGVPSAVIDITKVPHQVIRMGEYKE